MVRYIRRRAASAVIVLFLASIAIFAILRLAPGDPAVAIAGPDASPAVIHAIRVELGLERPLPAQYWTWLSGLFTGNLHQSYVFGAPIAVLMGNALSNTLELALGALLFAVVIALVIGIVSGISERKAAARAANLVDSLLYSVPPYVTGVLLVLVFAVTFRIFPASGSGPGPWQFPESIVYVFLPAVCLSLPTAAIVGRFLGASLRKTLESDFIRTAKARGISRQRLVWRHLVPNSMPPVLTIFGLQIGQLLSGAIIVETVFAWPGLGNLLVNSVTESDFLVTQDILMFAVLVFIVIQFLTDIANNIFEAR